MITKKDSCSSVIKCPHCGKMYNFDDIFIPSAVFKDGENVEQYVCDDTIDELGNVISQGCGKAFEVKVSITYCVSDSIVNDFDKETVIDLNDNTDKLCLYACDLVELSRSVDNI